MELIPRITRAQKMDALSSQANLAGYAAVMEAAKYLSKSFPMMMTAAGTISPVKVFVIGVGVAGLQAIATAKRLGARVEAFDTRPVVEEQVKSSQLIHQYKLETIATGYLLLKTDKKSAVEIISDTVPLDMNNEDLVLSHALAAQYFGMRYVYLENGSGADSSVDPNLIKYLSDNIDIPIIVGGGIKTHKQVKNIKNAGARFIVIGTLLEQNPDSKFISSLLD